MTLDIEWFALVVCRCVCLHRHLCVSVRAFSIASPTPAPPPTTPTTTTTLATPATTLQRTAVKNHPDVDDDEEKTRAETTMRAALFAAKRCSRSLAASTGRFSSRISVPASATTVLRSLSTVAVTGGERIAQLAEELPFKDIVRYDHKNVKWTLENVNRHSEDLAAGLLETGLIPGDVVLSWLPNHFAEQVRWMMLCWCFSFSGLSLPRSTSVC